MYFRLFLFSAILLMLCLPAQVARAAGTVRLELVGDARSVGMTFQEWGRTLSSAGIKNVRLRSSNEDVKPGIETQGTPGQPVYMVTGIVLSRRELLLPGGKFKRSEMGRLKQWLEDLAQQGPPEGRPAKTAFGLTVPQFQKVKADLARPVDFATKGRSRREVAEKIAQRLSHPLRMAPEIAQALAEEKVEEELTELSGGTALACVLRPAGYCLVPQVDGGRIAYVVVQARPDLAEIWPVGWPLKKRRVDVLPALLEFLNVDIQNYAAADAVNAIAKRLKTPVLYDRNALARHGIDPAKVLVTLPRSRTTYSIALRRLLFQARLKFEVRVDEAGTPFLWISTLKPVSQQAPAARFELATYGLGNHCSIP